MPQHFLVRSPAEGLRVIRHPAIAANFAKALRVRPTHKNAVLVPCAGTKPFPEAPSHKSGYLPALEGKRADVWIVSEPLGVVPYAWSRTWPNDAYDFPPKYLRGAAREALVARIGEWLDKVAPKYEHVYLALPGHHRRLLDEALEGRDLKIRDAGHGACIESGACPAGHGRATSHAYRGYLQRRIPNPVVRPRGASLWLHPHARPVKARLHPRFDGYPHFHASYEQYEGAPARGDIGDVEVRWVPIDDVWQAIPTDNEDESERVQAFIDDVERRMRAGEDIPPALMENGKLFDGRHRIAAADQAGLKRVPVVEIGQLWDRRHPNPGFELRQWRQPILWDAEKVEAEVGQVPPAALLLAAMQGPLVIPVSATMPGKRSRVRAGIEMEGLTETPGGSEIPAWDTPAVAALLAHHQPELAVSPSGHKWYSWREAAPALLSILIEHGARTASRHESEPIDLWIDSHLPSPPHHHIRFRAWTVPAEPRKKNPAEPCGDCFRYAVLEGTRGDAVKVFHGTIRDPESGRRFDHAWVEDPHGQLYDWQNQTRRVDPSKYYAELQPEDVVAYEPMQALRYAIANGHYGPWPPEERTETRKRPIPRLGPPGRPALPPKAPRAASAPAPRQTRRALDRQIRDANITGDAAYARELEAERDKLPPKKSRKRR